MLQRSRTARAARLHSSQSPEAGGRAVSPLAAAHQAGGWCPATMVAFVMAAFCCACDNSFIPLADVITGCLWNLRSGFGAERLDTPLR